MLYKYEIVSTPQFARKWHVRNTTIGVWDSAHDTHAECEQAIKENIKRNEAWEKNPERYKNIRMPLRD